MRLLILGGTVFLGRHVAEIAVAEGHAVTLFNRGQSAPEPPAAALEQIEQIHGDREHDLERLGGREWDAVIDTCGYVPRIVRESSSRLASCTAHYSFVSSISVYGTFPRVGIDEDHPVASLPEPGSEDVGRFYGELKAACESEVRDAFGDRALIVRSGLLVGPHDPTERFTYWVRRLAEGGPVLAAAPEQAVQLIDVRDLARWILAMATRRSGGTFNATGPAEPLVLRELLERIRALTGSGAELVWCEEQALLDAGVEPWSELPLWLGLAADPEMRGFMSTDIRRALAAGLELRALRDTIEATQAWVRARPGVSGKRGGVPLEPAGLASERERALLAQLRPGQ